jgi:hypothetical protein
VSKEYPINRKVQNAEDQERMSRILKRRAEDTTPGEKTNEQSDPESPSENDEPSAHANGKARVAGSSW